MINREQIYFLIIFLSGTLIGCVATHPVISHSVISPPDPLRQLQNNINFILSDSIFKYTHAGIKVVYLDNGKILYERDSKALMNPASNIKLITSAAALAMLDTGYKFKTSIFVDDSTIDSNITKNIYLKGYGDPNLTTSDLDSLAFAVHRFGINTINNIIVDNSFFDDNYWGAGWAWDDESDPDAPYIDALSVNKNCIRINLYADSIHLAVSTEPNTSFVTVINHARIVLDTIRTPLTIKRQTLSNSNVILIEGDVFRYSTITQKVSLRCPEIYTGMLFKESLLRAGVSIAGDIINGVVFDGYHEITQCFHSINKVIETMNKQSDNLSAENTLKVLSALKNGIPGSAKNGVLVEKIFLAGLGIDTSKFSIVDGSGVSRYNLMSADQLVQFLAVMRKQTRMFPMFYNSLSIAGIDGTLEDRMINYPVACNLHAKTGTLNGVSCLSGYVQTRDGEMLAFAIMMENFISSASDFHLAQDRIGSLLAKYSDTITTHDISTK